jgi:hypothetical protein
LSPKVKETQNDQITKDDDFNLEENLERISKNLSKLSKSEKMEFLKQESPELFELSKDFNEKVPFRRFCLQKPRFAIFLLEGQRTCRQADANTRAHQQRVTEALQRQ